MNFAIPRAIDFDFFLKYLQKWLRSETQLSLLFLNRTTENKEIGQLASVIWNLITGLYFVFRISGGLGTMGIKLAKALGNDVMAISSSAHKETLAKVITEWESSWKNKK